jgi:hypothetical protein
MIYETEINNTPVACTIVDWDTVTGKCLVEYKDITGVLQSWVDGDRIRPNQVYLDSSQ